MIKDCGIVKGSIFTYGGIKILLFSIREKGIQLKETIPAPEDWASLTPLMGGWRRAMGAVSPQTRHVAVISELCLAQ
jgi:hypothetical protein